MEILVNAIQARMGGILTYTRALSRLLPARLAPHPVTLVAPPAALDSKARGIAHVPAGVKKGAAPKAHLQIAERLARLRRPVLFATANFTWASRDVPQLLLARNAIYFDPLYEEHVLRRASPRERAGVLLRRNLCLASAEASRHVLTPTRAMRDLMIAARPSLAPRLEANPYGVDVAAFEAAADERRPSPRGTLKLVCHSLIARHKPTWPLLAAVERARARGVRATLTLLDSPFDPVHDGMADVADERALAARGLSEGWLTCLPRRGHETMPALLAQADAFVLHTLSESFGHPYVEALASGLPAVVADIPVARELCGDAARYVPLFDPEAVARHIEALAESPELRESLGRAGRAQVAGAGLSWERHFGRCADVLRALGEGRPVPPEETS